MDRASLAWRLAESLSCAERRLLALRLLEDDADTISFRRDNVRWTGFPWDVYVSWPLFIDGNLHGKELSALLLWMARHRRLDKQDVIVDVGANIGTSTIPFAQATDCRVLAIEPVPENFDVLVRNVHDNGLEQRITVVQLAVAADRTRVELALPATNSGGAEMLRPGRRASFWGVWPQRGVVEASAATLADILETHGIAAERVALVWSDTQGCEKDLIESAPGLWAAGVPLYAEFDPQVLAAHDGMDALAAVAAAHFGTFVTAQNIVRHGADAQHRPIVELRAVCASLAEPTNMLMLPEKPPAAR